MSKLRKPRQHFRTHVWDASLKPEFRNRVGGRNYYRQWSFDKAVSDSELCGFFADLTASPPAGENLGVECNAVENPGIFASERK